MGARRSQLNRSGLDFSTNSAVLKERRLLKSFLVNTMKRVSRLIFFAVMALAFPLSAAEKMALLLVGNRGYTNVTVIGFNATDLYFKHDGGFSNVRLKYLSDDLKKKFFFDAERAARAEAEQVEQDAHFSEALAKVDMAVQERLRAATAGPPAEAEIIDPLGKNSFIGKSAPAFKPEQWVTEKPNIEEKFQLIFIWSSESEACRRAIPKLSEFSKTFSNKLAVVAISSEPRNILEEFAKPKITFPSATDSKNKFAKDLGVTAIPCVVLIDPKGFIRYLGHPNALDAAILTALFVKWTEKS